MRADGITVTNHVAPKDVEKFEELRALRWECIQSINQLKNHPGIVPHRFEAIETANTMIDTIDVLLANAPLKLN